MTMTTVKCSSGILLVFMWMTSQHCSEMISVIQLSVVLMLAEWCILPSEP